MKLQAFEASVVVMATLMVMMTVLPSTLATRHDTINCRSNYHELMYRWCIHVGISAPTTHPGRSLTHAQARDKCAEIDGNLASIPTQEMLNKLNDYLNHNFQDQTDSTYTFWIGASRVGNIWTWPRANAVLSSLWLPGHPTPNVQAKHSILLNEEGTRYLLPFDGIAPAYICEQN